MKIFYYINEPSEGYQIGYRFALEKIRTTGIISEIKYFSFQVEKNKNKNWGSTLAISLNLILDFEPEIIIIAHSGNLYFPKSFFNKVRSALPKIKFVYDERDVYGILSKPVPLQMLNTAAQCDIVCLVAKGFWENLFRIAGCKNIHYLPHVADDLHFGKDWTPTVNRDFDVVMLANLSISKIRPNMPGIRERIKIVKLFYEYFGSRFGVFGNGWEELKCSQGKVSFFGQEKVLRNSWLSIGQDHYFNYNSYFSDRLPIALVSGVPHLTYNTKGVCELFKENEHCFYFNDENEALKNAKIILESPQNMLMGKAVELIKENYTEFERFKKMFFLVKSI